MPAPRRGDRGSAWRGMSPAMARPPSAPQAASSTTSSTAASICYNGGPLIAREKVVRNATLDDVTAFAQAGTLFAESPQTGNLPGDFPLARPRQAGGRRASSSRKRTTRPTSRSSATSASARSPKSRGSATSGATSGAAKNSNNITPYAYANPANLFNNEPISENFLRRDYPGMGTIRYLTTRRRHAELQRDAGQRAAPAEPRAADGHGLHAVEVRGHPGLRLADRGAVWQSRASAIGTTGRRPVTTAQITGADGR